MDEKGFLIVAGLLTIIVFAGTVVAAYWIYSNPVGVTVEEYEVALGPSS